MQRRLGSDWFTKRTLRFVWHLLSVAWLGFAATLILLAQSATPTPDMLLVVVAATFFVTAATAGLASRGKHLSWLVFLAIATLAWVARG